MADYIDRKAAIAFAEHAYFAWNLAMAAADGRKEINLVYKRQELCKAVASVFTDAPAADVAPVVRCRDCRNSYEGIDGRICSYGPCVDCVVPDDFFCRFGERRERNADR